jgi:hypothetical protein
VEGVDRSLKVEKWDQDLKANLEKQKSKMLSLMPAFIRKLRPTFEAPIVEPGHWWRFLRLDQNYNCMAVERNRDWTDKLKGFEGNDSFPLVEGKGLGPAPKTEWQFRSPLLVDRAPNVKTWQEEARFRDLDARKQPELHEEKLEAERAQFTEIVCRESHGPIWFSGSPGQKLHCSPRPPVSAEPVVFKVVPIKLQNTDRPALRLKGAYD